MVNATTIKPTKNWQCYDQTMPKEKIEKKIYWNELLFENIVSYS